MDAKEIREENGHIFKTARLAKINVSKIERQAILAHWADKEVVVLKAVGSSGLSEKGEGIIGR